MIRADLCGIRPNDNWNRCRKAHARGVGVLLLLFQGFLIPWGVLVIMAEAYSKLGDHSTAVVYWKTAEALQWNAPNATACAASGGNPGDGWTGINLPNWGSLGGGIIGKVT